MNPTTNTEAGAVADVAAKLTEARKAMVLALPADGSWGAVPSRSVAKRAWWNMIPGLIEHKHCPEDVNDWCLNDRGLAVRQHLEQGATAGVPELNEHMFGQGSNQ